jgi:hypothetical protein
MVARLKAGPTNLRGGRLNIESPAISDSKVIVTLAQVMLQPTGDPKECPLRVLLCRLSLT